jgi:membrane-associated phospholipid phosphatase
MAALAALLALGRVGAGLHYPSDALAGAALGFLLGTVFRHWP